MLSLFFKYAHESAFSPNVIILGPLALVRVVPSALGPAGVGGGGGNSAMSSMLV